MRRAAIALALVLACPFLLAQQIPALERGFSPEKVYHFGDIDAVNTFNGNLTIRIPIGPTYPVNGPLSYSLNLVYNSKVWDYEQLAGTVLAIPARRANAGMGWMVSLGRLISSQDNTNTSGNAVYEAPDGSQHHFWDDFPQPPNIGYTSDGSFLRKQTFSASSNVLIEFPDGTKDLYDSDGDLVSKSDRFGNAISVTHATDPTNTPCAFTPYFSAMWTISDGRRTNYICYTDHYDYAESVYPGVIERIVIAAPPADDNSARQASYLFHYTNHTFARGCHSTYLTGSVTLSAAALDSIDLPDGTAFVFHYNDYDPNAPLQHCEQGTIKEVDLPTNAYIKYGYQMYSAPVTGCPSTTQWNQAMTGITTRTMGGPGLSDATWTYTASESQAPPYFVGCENNQGYNVPRPVPAEELVTTITDPVGNVQEQHYSIWPVPPGTPLYDSNGNYYADADPSPGGFHLAEFGLPISHFTNSGGRFLSLDTYTPSGYSATPKSPLRSVYRIYEHDAVLCSDLNASCLEKNARLKNERTVYHDDNNSIADTDASEWDGYGHYRWVTMSGLNGNSVTTYTAWNTRDPDVNPNSGIDATHPPAAGDAWILNDPNSVTRTDGSGEVVSQSCWDPSTGFLRATRVLAGTSHAANDVLTLFASENDRNGNPTGNVAVESFFGGDIKANSPDAPLCFIADSPPTDYEYRISHTYSGGVRATSQYTGATFYSLNRTIDTASGTMTSSADTADVTTNYKYDTSFRLIKIAPPSSLAPTSFTYVPSVGSGTSFQPARVEVKTSSATSNTSSGATTSGTIEKHYEYDALGRLWRERTRMPDDSCSVRQTTYTLRGDKDTVSEQEQASSTWPCDNSSYSPLHLTHYSNYDPFGRPGRVLQPDGVHDTTLTYYGVGSLTRTMGVAMSTTGESAQSVTEVYDRQGRLYAVTENSGTNGAAVTTTYGYDGGGRLFSVLKPSQYRYFIYDGRGFLDWEQHPEKGDSSGNGQVLYGYRSGSAVIPQYDSRGHARRRIDGPADLTFIFDSAERLTEVDEVDPNNTASRRMLKQFAFAAANSGSNYQKGKLVTATRVNHLTDGREVRVAQTNTYAGPGGAISSRSTAITVNGASFQTFTDAIQYDDIGAVSRLSYPACSTTCAGIGGGIGTLERHYTNGPLASITGYANSIAYAPNGMVSAIAHANGVTDTIVGDDSGVARPKSITFSGFVDCPVPSTPTITPAATTLCQNDSSSASVSAQTGVTYAWTIDGGAITSAATGTTVTFTATSSTSVTLHVTASNSCGSSPTASSTITILAATAITQNPQSTAVNYNGSTTLHVTDAGTNVARQWYVGNSGDTSNPIAGQTGHDLPVGPLTVTTSYWVRVSGQCGAAVNSTTATVTVTNLPAPTGVRATTQTTNTQVVVRWNSVANVSGYAVEYATNTAGPFGPVNPSQPITLPTQTSITHVVSATSNPVAYVYRVRSVDSGGNISVNSSNIDYAVAGAQLFAIGHTIDEPLRKTISPVRANDIVELRSAIDALRAAVSLPAQWSGAGAPSGVIRASDFTSLQAPLNQALQAFGWPNFAYNGVAAPAACVTPPCVKILSEHVQQLRDTLRNALR